MAKAKYRILYEQSTGTEIPEDFHIHHIDFDRENNDISNLVALPKQLHLKYHYYQRLVVAYPLNSLLKTDYGYRNWVKNHERFIEVFKLCCEYVDYRNRQLSIMHAREMFRKTPPITY